MPRSKHSVKFVVIDVQTRDIRFRTRPKGRLMNVTVGKITDRAMHSLLPPINYLSALARRMVTKRKIFDYSPFSRGIS